MPLISENQMKLIFPGGFLEVEKAAYLSNIVKSEEGVGMEGIVAC